MKRIFFSVFLLIIGYSIAFVEESSREIHDLDTLLKAMEQREDVMKTISFAFSQELEINYTGEKQKIRGKAYFKKPKFIRVENHKPQKNFFITDGTTVWYYAPSQKQVMVGSWDTIASESGNFFKGLLNISERFTSLATRYHLSYEGKKGGYYIITLQSREKKRDFFKMTAWIGEHDLVPHKTMLTIQAMTIHTAMKKIKIDKPLSDTLFTFVIPSGVDTIPFP